MPEIKLKFDTNQKPIEPAVVLATRSCDKLGAIIANDLVVKGSLKNGYEISFIANKASNPNWDMISDLKLVWIPEWDIWFEISVKINETNYLYKDILGTSLGEAELSQIIIRNTEINTETDISRSDYEPTIIYNSNNPSASLMHRLMEKAPHYKVSHIDTSLAKLQRTFTFDKKSLRDCLNEVAEEIDGLIIIDSGSAPDGSIQRSISMYDLKRHCDDCGHRIEDNVSQCPKCGGTNITDGYGEDSGIFVCSENLSNNIDLETNVGAVKNCFKLEAGDDVMTAAITACCPNGSGYLWYISDETRADMSKDLRTKLAAYDNALSEVESRTFNLIDSISADTLSQYNTIAVKYNKNSLGTINGYTNLQTAIYDIIDFGLYIEHGMMPSGGIPATTAAEQLTNLVNNLSPVSVQRLQGLSSTTASSYISQAARAIMDPRYNVTIDNATLNGTSWNGDIAITSYSDESDTASYENFSVSLNENYTEYVKKLIDRILNTKEYLEFDIVALFKLNNTEFADKIKEYSLASLKTFFDACQACLNIMIERSGIGSNSELGSLYSEYYSKQGLLQNEISVREHEAKVIENIQECLLSIVTGVHDELDFKKYLGNELWTEFSAYRREDTYRNENYISDGLDNAQLLEKAMEFIKTAQQEIAVAGTAQYSISSTLYNLMAMPEFKGVSDNFKLGNWIRIRVDNKIYILRLIEYSLRFDSLETIDVTYSDVMYNGTIGQDIDDIRSLQDSYKSMASSYGSVSKQASKGNDTNNQLRSWVSDGLEVSKVRFLDDAVNQNMTWGKNGMLFRKYDEVTEDYSPEQLKIINSTIAVTDSNWETVKTAIGGFDYLDPVDNTVKHGYGINAELLIGKLIIGEELGLYNKTNSLSFNDNGLKISNGKNTFTVNPNGESEVLSLSKKDTQGIDRKLLWTDDNGELNIRVKSFSLTGVNGDKNLEDIIEETKGLQMVLTNEYKGVPTDCDGNYTGNLSVQTSVKVYYGHMDVTDACVYTTETSQGVVGNWDNENKSYIVTTLTDDSGWVDITAAYSGLTVTKRFNLSKIRAGATGSDGAPGADGRDGRGIGSITNYYASSSDNLTSPATGWQSDISQVPWNINNKYLWSYEKTVYTDGTNYSTTKHVIAIFTKDGASGTNGSDGRGIVSITEHYGLSNSSETEPSSWNTQPVSPTSEQRYLWNYEVIKYTTGADTVTEKHVVGVYGETGKSSYLHIKYSPIANPTASQMTETPSKYMGTYVDNISADSTNPEDYTWYKVQGTDGAAGASGEDGKTSYFHVKYSPIANPTAAQMTETPAEYMGTYVDYTEADSNDPSKYKWFKVQGSDGAPGTNGADGKDGRNYFIETSVNTIKCDSDGTVTPSNLIVYSYYTEGNSSTKYAAPTTFKAYTVGREDTEYYYSEWDSFHSQIEIDLTEWVSNDTAYIEIESGNGSKTIPVVAPIIDTMTQEDVFNKLTNNGETQGLYLQDGKVYLNAEYIKSGTISAIDIEGCNISATLGDWVAKYNASGMSFWDNNENKSKFSINRFETFNFGNNYIGNQPCVRADYLPVMGTNESGYYSLMFAPNGLPSFDGTPYGIPGVMWINGGHGINMSSFSQTSNDQYQNRLICGNLVYLLSNGVQMYPVVINESLFSNTMITSTLYTQNLNVTGSKYRVVATDTYGVVSMNAVESATPMFIDIGSGNVGSDGKIDILYDEKFSETVDTICESQVFITPTSAKKISYIEKHSGYFTVYGDADATFDWIIYCPQKGYTTERMESAVCPDNANVPNVDETIFEQNSSADFATQENMNEYTNISQNLLEEGENNS